MADLRPPLVTDRLILRDLEPDDWRALYAIESDPDTVRYLPREPFTADQAKAYIDYDLDRRQRSPRRMFDLAVTPREEGVMIGRCGLRAGDGDDAALWYVLDPRRRGAGLMLEAARAMVDFAFRGLGLRRLWADLDPRNDASVRLVERLGMRREAHHLENIVIKGELCGTLIYALLRREWEAGR